MNTSYEAELSRQRRKQNLSRRIGETRASIPQLLLLIALTLGLPAYVWTAAGAELSISFIPFACLTIYAGVRLTHQAFTKKESFLQLQFWLFVYCWFGLAASTQVGTHTFPWSDGNRQTPQNIIASFLVIAAGIGSYEIAVSRKRRREDSQYYPTLVNPDIGRCAITVSVCILLSALGIARQGGLSVVLRTRGEVDEFQQVTHELLLNSLVNTNLQRVPPMVALLVTIYLILARVGSRNTRSALKLLAAVLLVTNLAANYIPAMPRFSAGFIVVSISTLFCRSHPRLKPIFTIGMIGALVAAFPYLDYFRTNRGYTKSDLSAIVVPLVSKADYDAFEMLTNTVAATSDLGFDYGYNLIGSACFFVPRNFWSTKPHGTGSRVTTYLGYVFTNVSCPFWAELYFSGGIILVAIGFWFYGRATLAVEFKGIGLSNPGGLLVAYLAGYQIVLLRGDLINTFALTVPGLLCLLCFLRKPPFESRRFQTRIKRARNRVGEVCVSRCRA